MSVKLKWVNHELMLGAIQVGEVDEAGIMSGHKARWWLSGHHIGGSVTDGRDFKERNQNARKQCWDAATKALADVGLEVTP